MVNLGRCDGSCNTLNDLFTKVCVLNERWDLNLSVFNIITGINESKILTMHISCKFKFKFYGRKWNSNQKRNNNKCWCECKNTKKLLVNAKDYIWILLHVVVKMENI